MSRMLNLPGSWGSEVGPQPWVHRLGLPVTVHPGFVATGSEGAVRKQGQPQVRAPPGSGGLEWECQG